ncbi:MAG: glycosyltransferase [Burkholderiales bacterium]|nr:glycosyltransferase [Burkholderiales bacterium]
MTHVMLLTGNALCNNPRAQKEAEALAGAGFRVTIAGAWLSEETKRRDRAMLAGAPYAFEVVLDLADGSARGEARALVARARTGIARKCHAVFGLESRGELGYAVDGLLRHAVRSDAQLFIAHSEAGLHAARALYRRGRRIGVDMEDWFSEDLAPEAKRDRPVALLRELERDVLKASAHATCTSATMSQALAERYGCAPPRVVYNAFPWADRQRLDGQRKDRASESRLSIHWYSQTLGPGRGLEDLMEAISRMSADAVVHLRGHSEPSYREQLISRVAPERRGRIRFHETVPGAELLSRIAEHDVGFSGEVPPIPSRNLTITNKMLHYLLAGLPVVASDTAGGREVASQAGEAVHLWSSGDSRELASRLDALLLDPDRLARAKAAALEAAATFCWERCSRALVDSVAKALGRGAV